MNDKILCIVEKLFNGLKENEVKEELEGFDINSKETFKNRFKEIHEEMEYSNEDTIDVMLESFRELEREGFITLDEFNTIVGEFYSFDDFIDGVIKYAYPNSKR